MTAHLRVVVDNTGAARRPPEPRRGKALVGVLIGVVVYVAITWACR